MKIKKFTDINENIDEPDDIFVVGEIISYDYKYVAKVVGVHEGYELLDIILYNPKGATVNKPSTVSSRLCVKFYQL